MRNKVCIILDDFTNNPYYSNFIEWLKANYDTEIVYVKSRLHYFKKFQNLVTFPFLNIEKYIFNRCFKTSIKNDGIKILELDYELYFSQCKSYDYIINFTIFNNIAIRNNCTIINTNTNANYYFDSISWKNIISSILLNFDYCSYSIKIYNSLGRYKISGDIPTTKSILQLHNNLLRKELECVKIYLQGDSILKQEIISSEHLSLVNLNYFHWFKYYFNFLKVIFLKIFFSQNGLINYWNVGYYFGKWDSFDFKNFKSFKIKGNSYIADPFIFTYNNNTYCFVEEYIYAKKKGVISYYILNNKEFIYTDIIIEEEFHLSFPFIFEHDGNVYLCPESTANKDIRLYKAIDFPIKWELSSLIMQNVNAADSMLFYKSNLWWLFTNINTDFNSENCSDFSIFYSTNLFTDKWEPHSCNPISRSSLNARNGGYFISKNKLYRVNQQHGLGIYGKKFQINEVVVLNSKEYKEVYVKAIGKEEIGDIIGTHHFTSMNDINVFDFVYNAFNKIKHIEK